MKLSNLKDLMSDVQKGDLIGAIDAIDTLLKNETGVHWIRDLKKLREFIATGNPQFTIFAKGNSKLPFVSFSALPGEGFCPGAGDCLSFCYSFKAFRYPAAFCRMVQNTILLTTKAGRITLQFQLAQKAKKFTADNPLTLRLYVDGDFRNQSDVSFWFKTLQKMPNIAAYGYSKSFTEIYAYASANKLPENYVLNVSGGHRHGSDLVNAIKELPITRGEFIAIAAGKKASPAELRAAHTGKAFTCPGKCGECTPKGHACGSKRFANVDIIIAVH
jgi:hypothetical protein